MGSEIHSGVKAITRATAVRWFGWAIVDPLVPVFLFLFSGSFAETGIIVSIYSIVFLVSIPLVSFISDHIRAKYVILAGLAIYPFIALSYYFAGLYGIAAGIAIARALNGVSYALDATGRTTYMRRHTIRERVGEAFGFFQIWTEFWRIGAMLLSLIAVQYFEIYQLFLVIIPTTLIAMFIVARVPDDACDYQHKADWMSCVRASTYLRFVQEVVIWKSALKRLAGMAFVLNAVRAAISVFVPIILYTEGVSLEKIIIFAIISSIPLLFGYHAGKIADRYGIRLLPIVMSLLAISLAGLAFIEVYEHYLLFIFVFNSLMSVALIVIDSEMTRRGDNRRYGTLSGAILEVGEFASVVSPVVVGAAITAFGAHSALLGLAGITLVSALTGVRGMR